MNRTGISARAGFTWLAWFGACAMFLVGVSIFWSVAQAQGALVQAGPPPGQTGGASGKRGPQAPAKPFPLTLTITEGTDASYRVREQLAGINFPNDAVGTSTAVTGMIVFSKDGSIDSKSSKLTFDLRALKSDQAMRDGFIQRQTLDTGQYPMAEFVPKTIEGMPNPLVGQFGFQLTGDMTIHGTTAPVTWQGIATVDTNNGFVAGRATTEFKFETFGLTTPKIARVMSVNDNITLEIELRLKES